MNDGSNGAMKYSLLDVRPILFLIDRWRCMNEAKHSVYSNVLCTERYGINYLGIVICCSYHRFVLSKYGMGSFYRTA